MEKSAKIKAIKFERHPFNFNSHPKRIMFNEKLGMEGVERLAHDKHIDRLAKPKKYYEPPPVVRKKVPLDTLLPRIERLAQPKFRLHFK